MSLKIHFPFNGNLYNYGEDASIKVSAVPSRFQYKWGKFGLHLNMENKDADISFYSEVLNEDLIEPTHVPPLEDLETYTISCWVKINSDLIKGNGHSRTILSSGNWNDDGYERNHFAFALYNPQYESSKNCNNFEDYIKYGGIKEELDFKPLECYKYILVPIALNRIDSEDEVIYPIWSRRKIALKKDNFIYLDKWYHITITYSKNTDDDWGNTFIYVNGNPNHSTPLNNSERGTYYLNAGGIPGASIYTYIGSANYLGSNHFGLSGEISNLKIYDKALSLDEIKNLYLNDPNRLLFCNYKFDTDVIKDESGFKNHPIKSNLISSLKDNDNKAIGVGSYKFDNSYLALPQNLKLKDTFTYNIWAYKDDWSTWNNEDDQGRIISCTSNGGYNIELNSGTLDFIFYIKDLLNNYFTGYKRIKYKEWKSLSSGWHMFTFSLDNDKGIAKAYIDGEMVGQNIWGETQIFTYFENNSIIIGAEAGWNLTEPNTGLLEDDYFKGNIDDFRFYNYCLTENEILSLYRDRLKLDNLGKVKTYCLNEVEVDSTSNLGINDKGILTMNEFIEVCMVKSLKFTSNGSSANASNHISRVIYKDINGNEIALIDASQGAFIDNDKVYNLLYLLKDENGENIYKDIESIHFRDYSNMELNHWDYDDGKSSFVITLKNPTIISKINLRRYYYDKRAYYQQKIEGSSDGINYFTIFDSGNTNEYNEDGYNPVTGDGLYIETQEGKWFDMPFNHQPMILLNNSNNKIIFIGGEFIEE